MPFDFNFTVGGEAKVINEGEKRTGRDGENNGVLTADEVARLLNINIGTVLLWSEMGVFKLFRTGVVGERKYQHEDIKKISP